jgi:hypothetical protein
VLPSPLFFLPTGLLSVFPVRPAQQRRKYACSGTLATLDPVLDLVGGTCNQGRPPTVVVTSSFACAFPILPFFCTRLSPTNLSVPLVSASPFRPLLALPNVTIAGPPPALLYFAFPGPFSLLFSLKMTSLSLVADLSYTSVVLMCWYSLDYLR